MESMVTCTHFRYTGDQWKLGICSLTEPAAIEKIMSFHTKIQIYGHVIVPNKLGPDSILEQLERLRPKNTPHRPMITHTIDSYQIPSKKRMERM